MRKENLDLGYAYFNVKSRKRNLQLKCEQLLLSLKDNAIFGNFCRAFMGNLVTKANMVQKEEM